MLTLSSGDRCTRVGQRAATASSLAQTASLEQSAYSLSKTVAAAVVVASNQSVEYPSFEWSQCLARWRPDSSVCCSESNPRLPGACDLFACPLRGSYVCQC